MVGGRCRGHQAKAEESDGLERVRRGHHLRYPGQRHLLGGFGAVQAYVFSNFFSNFWPIFGKFLEARSRLYRRQILQVNTRLKALDEIYKIYTLLHLGTPI